MNHFIAFLNSFLSYLLVFAISVIGVGVAIFFGIFWRKKKNLAEANVEATVAVSDTTSDAEQ